MDHLGIGVVGKRKCVEQRSKITKERYDEFFFGNDRNEIHDLLSRIQPRGKCSTKEQS